MSTKCERNIPALSVLMLLKKPILMKGMLLVYKLYGMNKYRSVDRSEMKLEHRKKVARKQCPERAQGCDLTVNREWDGRRTAHWLIRQGVNCSGRVCLQRHMMEVHLLMHVIRTAATRA